MDDRTRQMIEAYIPNPPDPSLEMSEYFYCRSTSSGDKIIRVFALDILPHRDGVEYGLYQKRGGRLCRIDTRGDGDRSRGAPMSALYDNYQDCKDQNHYMYERWEWLRERQQAEQEES